MSYFKKIVERTLKAQAKVVDSGSVKPAIIPESIPEPFEPNARSGTRTRKITPYSTSGSAKKQPDNAPRPAVEGWLREQLVSTTAASAAPVSPAKKVAHARSQDMGGVPNPIMMPGSMEQAEVPQTENERTPDLDLVAVAPVAAAPVILHATTEVGSAEADAASQTKPLEPNGLLFKDSVGSQQHPQLRPATEVDEKYYVTIAQPDETTVTVNIGRIEVRAVTPAAESRSLSRKEYSPPLSLDDYLRQRMEGRKK